MEKANSYIQTYISSNAKQKFQNLCSEEGLTASHCVRQMITNYIKKKEDEQSN